MFEGLKVCKLELQEKADPPSRKRRATGDDKLGDGARATSGVGKAAAFELRVCKYKPWNLPWHSKGVDSNDASGA